LNAATPSSSGVARAVRSIRVYHPCRPPLSKPSKPVGSSHEGARRASPLDSICKLIQTLTFEALKPASRTPRPVPRSLTDVSAAIAVAQDLIADVRERGGGGTPTRPGAARRVRPVQGSEVADVFGCRSKVASVPVRDGSRSREAIVRVRAASAQRCLSRWSPPSGQGADRPALSPVARVGLYCAGQASSTPRVS
jgi:histidinol dehydrogenase